MPSEIELVSVLKVLRSFKYSEKKTSVVDSNHYCIFTRKICFHHNKALSNLKHFFCDLTVKLVSVIPNAPIKIFTLKHLLQDYLRL